MLKRSYKSFSVTLISNSFLIALLVSTSSLHASDKFTLPKYSIEQSILERYQQKLVQSYHYYREILGFEKPPVKNKTKNFPVLIENNIEFISQQRFHTELYFSRLHSIEIEPRIIIAKIKDKLIRISNVPVRKGFLSSKFGLRKDPIHGLRRMHKGIDIAAKSGSSVNPLGEGEVVFAGYKAGYGHTVEIKHGSSVLTRYAHLKQSLVEVGQQVNHIDEIGLIGSSGRSTGPHLHLEVLFNGKQVDPQIFLANHFGSRANSYQIAKKTTSGKSIGKAMASIVMNKVSSKASKLISDSASNNASDNDGLEATNYPQLSYSDYVNSVDGLFGFSAPTSFDR